MTPRNRLWLQLPIGGGRVVVQVHGSVEPTAADYRKVARFLVGMADIVDDEGDDDEAPEDEGLDRYLAETAKACSACTCWGRPCGSCQAGGVCDGVCQGCERRGAGDDDDDCDGDEDGR